MTNYATNGDIAGCRPKWICLGWNNFKLVYHTWKGVYNGSAVFPKDPRKNNPTSLTFML